MSGGRFDRWFEWLMTWEGETFENDPDDRGGATKFGLDKASHPELDIESLTRTQASHPELDIESLTRTQAKEVYRTEYWQRVRADELPFGIGEVVADIAVNNGPTRAAKWLQIAVGAAPDGVIGPRTIAASKRTPAKSVCLSLLHRREIFYRSIARGRQVKFLQGWLNRNNSLETNFVRVL